MSFRKNHTQNPQTVYEGIKMRILNVELLPQTSLGEQKLAQEYGVSRTPVREALLRLSSEGLVEIIPNRGAFVSPIRYEYVETAQFVREALEIAIAIEASRHLDEMGKLRLRQFIEQQSLANEQGAVHLFYEADENMHREIAIIAQKPLVWEQINEVKTHLDRARKLNLIDSVSFHNLVEQHERIIAALCAGDESAIRDAVIVHMRQILPDLNSLRAQHPDYFA